MSARVWVEVNLDAIRHNIQQLKARVAPSQLLVVVKSNAYGHGLLPVAQVAVDQGVWGLAVVNVDEAMELRHHQFTCPVVVVGPVFEFEMAAAIEAEVALPVYSVETAQAVSRTAQKLGRTAKIHVKVDTGLSRLAEPVDNCKIFLELCSLLPNLEIEGIYSHYADAEGLDQSYTISQFKKFQKALQVCSEVGLKPTYRHISASAAGLLLEEARLDLVRTGIASYGLWPAEETKILMASGGQALLETLNRRFADGQSCEVESILIPALSWKTRVSQVKSLPANTPVGYGCSFTTSRPTKIAVLPVGYYEGYDRHLSNQGEVIIRGHRARVLGRVCMNVLTVDVTDIPQVELGDEVVLLGAGGGSCPAITAEEIARKIGTINYEVVTRIPAHLPRVYLPASSSSDEKPKI